MTSAEKKLRLDNRKIQARREPLERLSQFLYEMAPYYVIGAAECDEFAGMLERTAHAIREDFGESSLPTRPLDRVGQEVQQ